MAKIQEINHVLYVALPKLEAARLNWRKGTSVIVGRLDSSQPKLVIEEQTAKESI